MRESAAWIAKVLVIVFLLLSAVAFSQTWTATTAPLTNWVGICSSADGNRLAALIDNGGVVYVSTNAGATWNLSGPPNGLVLGSGIACSADGRVIAAAGFRDPSGEFAGNVFVSTNGGANWFTASPYKSWTSITCSADGSQFAGACASRRSFGAGILLSPDSGVTWTGSGAAPSDSWLAITSSADGQNLSAYDNFTGSIYTSADAGISWALHTPQPQSYTALACSADGTRLLAASNGNTTPAGPIVISTNAGLAWVQSSAPLTNWAAIACSSDARHIVAAGGGTSGYGHLYTSDDFGNTWLQANPPVAHWTSVACSADGQKMAAAVYGRHIYTLQLSPFAVSPKLNIGSSNGKTILSWLVPSVAFKLQQATDLSAANWTDVNSAKTLTNVEYQVVVPTPAGSSFFRLSSE